MEEKNQVVDSGVISSEMPLVTIVTSVLNGASTLEAAIDSVACQTYRNVEYLVIDGGSVDATVAILHARNADVDYWISEPDRGVYDAWNKALRRARGRWIMFLGADDELLSDAVSVLVDAIRKAPFVPDFVSGRAQLKTKRGRVVGSAWEWERFRRYCCIAHTGALHNVDFFSEYGEFDSQFRICGDYDLLLRAGPQLRYLFVDRVLVTMGYGGLSKNNKAVFREATRAKLVNKARRLVPALLDELIAYGKWQVRRVSANLGWPLE